MHKKIISLCLGFITFSNAYGAANNAVSIRQNNPYENTFEEPSEADLKKFEIQEQAKATNRQIDLNKLNEFKASTLPVIHQLQALLPHVNVQTVSEQITAPNDSLPENIRHMQKQIKNLADYTDNLNDLIELDSKNQNAFKNAMTSDFSLQILLIIMKRLQFCSNLPARSNTPETKDRALTVSLKYCRKEDLEKINPHTGQNIIHNFTPLHWHKNAMACLAQKARLDIPTEYPDAHPGSTMLHNVAHQVYDKSKNYSRNRQSEHIDNAMNFLITCFNNGYAHVLVRASISNIRNDTRFTCWHAFPEEYKKIIYNALTREAIFKIYHEIYEQETNRQITKEVANSLRAAFPVKL